MKNILPAWMIVVAAIGQIFTALIYPYIRHVVFDWYTDIKKLKPGSVLNIQIAKMRSGQSWLAILQKKKLFAKLFFK